MFSSDKAKEVSNKEWFRAFTIEGDVHLVDIIPSTDYFTIVVGKEGIENNSSRIYPPMQQDSPEKQEKADTKFSTFVKDLLTVNDVTAPFQAANIEELGKVLKTMLSNVLRMGENARPKFGVKFMGSKSKEGNVVFPNIKPNYGVFAKDVKDLKFSDYELENYVNASTNVSTADTTSDSTQSDGLPF